MSEVSIGHERDGRAMGAGDGSARGGDVVGPPGVGASAGQAAEARAEWRLVADQAAWNRSTRRAGNLDAAREVKWLAARPELRLGRARTSYGGVCLLCTNRKVRTGSIRLLRSFDQLTFAQPFAPAGVTKLRVPALRFGLRVRDVERCLLYV